MASSRRKNPLARPPLPSPTPETAGDPAIPRAALLILAPVLLASGVVGGFFGRGLIDGGSDDDGQGAANAPVFTAGGELRQETHDHADFAVYVRGQRLDFNQPEFLSSEGKDLSKNVHIHAPRTNVVHIHREQTTWDEFLTSLGMGVDDSCLTIRGGEKLCNAGSEALKFFVNGVQIDSLQFQDLADLDRVLISFGSDDDATIGKQLDSVTDEACIPGEQCKARIDPDNKDQEPCTRTGTTCVK